MLDENFWKKYFKAYDVLNKAIPYQELLNDIIVAADVKKGQSVLDAGSGTGNLSIKLKKQGADVISLDYSSIGIEIHQKKDPESKVVLGSLLDKLPFSNNFFDRIVTNNVIYTLKKEYRDFVFREFYRVFKKDGKIVISNLRVGFQPLVIFLDHFKKSVKKIGLIKTLFDLFILSYQTIKIFYFNYLISKENKNGSYDFMEDDEQKILLAKAGFIPNKNSKLSYSRQNCIDVGIKK